MWSLRYFLGNDLCLLLQSMKDLPDFVKFKVFPGYDLKDVFIAGTEDLLCIMKKLLAMDPLQRCSATEVYIKYCFVD